MATKKYLTRYFEEQSKVDRDDYFEVNDKRGDLHVLSYGTIIDVIMDCPEDAGLAQIASTIRKIDFHNGDVGHFLRHLAVGYVNNL